MTRVNDWRTTDVTRVFKTPVAELIQNACGERTKYISFSSVFSRVLNEQIQSAHIHIHVFHPAQDSSLWLRLTSGEQLMSPECSKHQVLSLAKMLVVNEQKTFYSRQCSPECSMNKYTCSIKYNAPGVLSNLVTSIVLYSLTRATLMSHEQDETRECGYVCSEFIH